MIMTAELNSHQRISYYTGVKLIRHHQNSNNGNSGTPTTGGTTSGGRFYQHQHQQHHFPPPPPHHHQQHPPPPLPPHHPGHYHLPCPTGPPHLQHPGRVLHLNSQHGSSNHPHQNHGHHHYGPGGGGSNQTTRLYTGSPLIRSSSFHSSAVSTSGHNKRSIKNHHHSRNHHIPHHQHSVGNRHGGLSQQNHISQNIIRGSCSSGSSSSSSSNEHLNSLQSPSGSPLSPEKLDISPLKLSASSSVHEETSSTSSLSNNSSPGPQESPTPSNASSSSSASPSSSDGNKDFDHFYFMDEHWKPSSDGSGGSTNLSNVNEMIIMDMSSNMQSTPRSAQWASSDSGSSSPPVRPAAPAALTMMVDQFFANGGGPPGSGHRNFGGLVVDSNNNVVGGTQQPDFNETSAFPPHRDQNNQLYQTSFSGFNNSGNGIIGGSSGLINFGGAKCGGSSLASSTSTTVVNVETQIGTFNGQRDLEIRLCFIKGDNRNGNLGGSKQSESYSDAFSNGNGTNQNNVTTVIGDPFSSSSTSMLNRQQQVTPETVLPLPSQTRNDGSSIAELPASSNEVIQQN